MGDSLHSRRKPHFDSAFFFFFLNEDNNKRRANARTKEFGTETMINRKRKHSFCFLWSFVLQLRMILIATERRVRNNMIVKKRKRQNGKSVDTLGFFCFVFVCLFSFLYSLYNDSTDRHSFQSNGMGKNPKTDCKFSCLFSY